MICSTPYINLSASYISKFIQITLLTCSPKMTQVTSKYLIQILHGIITRDFHHGVSSHQIFNFATLLSEAFLNCLRKHREVLS